MQKSQSQQRLDRPQCMTSQACQEINTTIFITAHHSTIFHGSDLKSVSFTAELFSASAFSEQLMSHRSLWETTQPCTASSVFHTFSRKESHSVRLCSFPLTSPSAAADGVTHEGRSGKWQQTGRTGLRKPWAQRGLRGDTRILSWCHCGCTRTVISLFLTLSLIVDFSVSKSKEMFRIKPKEPRCKTLFSDTEDKSKERSLQRKYQKTVKPSFTRILTRRKLIIVNIKNYF